MNLYRTKAGEGEGTKGKAVDGWKDSKSILEGFWLLIGPLKELLFIVQKTACC